jgi:predicted double-glycine peptidase
MDPLKQWADVVSGAGLAVPDVTQATRYTCGPSVLDAALQYFRKASPGEAKIAATMGTTPENGTTYDQMLKGAAAFGLDAELVEGATVADLSTSLEAGELPLVPLQAWASDEPPPGGYEGRWTNAHFVVVVAIDLDRGDILFEDPALDGARGYLTIPEFESRWHVLKDDKPTEGVVIITRGDGPTALRAPTLDDAKAMG